METGGFPDGMSRSGPEGTFQVVLEGKSSTLQKIYSYFTRSLVKDTEAREVLPVRVVPLTS